MRVCHTVTEIIVLGVEQLARIVYAVYDVGRYTTSCVFQCGHMEAYSRE